MPGIKIRQKIENIENIYFNEDEIKDIIIKESTKLSKIDKSTRTIEIEFDECSSGGIVGCFVKISEHKTIE